MMASPYLILNRLVVTGHNRIVYDQPFHAGVNIIRGENSSGKSTISDMIFYVLGGENIEWTDEAESCDTVYAEFDVPGLTLSLRRRISSESPPPIEICEGPLVESFKSIGGWSSFGRIRTSHRESFSQFMFERIGFPQTKSDDSLANVTMYQVLRLLYGDQNTDSTSIFRRERQVFADRQDMRRSVGEMLLGIDDLQGHDLRLEQIEKTKQLASKKSRYNSLSEAAETTDQNFSLSNYKDLLKQAQEKQYDIEEALEEASKQTQASVERKKEENAKIRDLEGKISKKNVKIEALTLSIESLAINIADSEIFITSLESNLNDLKAANKTQELIGSVTLAFCPICLADLAPPDEGHCPLCKTDNGRGATTGGRIRYEQELKHQISESKLIYGRRKQKIIEEKTSLKKLRAERNRLLDELKTIISPTNHIDATVSQWLKDHGYLTRQIEDLTKLESLQEEVTTLAKEVTDLSRKLKAIERKLKKLKDDQEARRNHCQQCIGDLTIDILHQDIVDNNKDTLSDATGLVFSFEKDFLSVRQGRLSASTQAFLKNSFYLGLLKFALEDDQCRLPKFFILDNIEDKGMVPERFRKFHHLLIDYSKTISAPHQVILTTSYIDEKLDNSEYCVGPSYDQPPYTLDLKGDWS